MSETTNKWIYNVRLSAAQKARFDEVRRAMERETMTDLSYNDTFIRLISAFSLPAVPENRTIHAATEKAA